MFGLYGKMVEREVRIRNLNSKRSHDVWRGFAND
jgi:hypothetical protein